MCIYVFHVREKVKGKERERQCVRLRMCVSTRELDTCTIYVSSKKEKKHS